MTSFIIPVSVCFFSVLNVTYAGNHNCLQFVNPNPRGFINNNDEGVPQREETSRRNSLSLRHNEQEDARRIIPPNECIASVEEFYGPANDLVEGFNNFSLENIYDDYDDSFAKKCFLHSYQHFSNITFMETSPFNRAAGNYFGALLKSALNVIQDLQIPSPGKYCEDHYKEEKDTCLYAIAHFRINGLLGPDAHANIPGDEVLKHMYLLVDTNHILIHPSHLDPALSHVNIPQYRDESLVTHPNYHHPQTHVGIPQYRDELLDVSIPQYRDESLDVSISEDQDQTRVIMSNFFNYVFEQVKRIDNHIFPTVDFYCDHQNAYEETFPEFIEEVTFHQFG